MSPINQNEKNMVVSFVHYLRQKMTTGQVNEDQKESLDVAIQCIEAAFSISEPDYNFHPVKPLDELFAAAEAGTSIKQEREATEAEKAEAERLKNEGNELMKQADFQRALERYTDALNLHNSPIFYCNRAAAYSKLEQHDKSIEDCRAAVALDPRYSKAYGRMGLALSCQDRYAEAAEAYREALKLEPANDSFKNNLDVAEQRLRDSAHQQPPNPFGTGGLGGMDLGAVLNNPAMMQMASQMFSNPEMQQVMSNVMGGMMGGQGGGGGAGGGPGMENLLRAGQMLASQMQQTNPDLVDQLRRNFPDQPPGPHDDDPPPPSGNDGSGTGS